MIPLPGLAEVEGDVGEVNRPHLRVVEELAQVGKFPAVDDEPVYDALLGAIGEPVIVQTELLEVVPLVSAISRQPICSG